jgi:hypothetical protein
MSGSHPCCLENESVVGYVDVCGGDGWMEMG